MTGGMAGWVAGWPDGRVAGWPHGRVAGWPDGRVAGWPDGRMAGWPGGRVAGWPGGRAHKKSIVDSSMGNWNQSPTQKKIPSSLHNRYQLLGGVFGHSVFFV